MKRPVILIVLLASLALLAGCGARGPAATATPPIKQAAATVSDPTATVPVPAATDTPEPSATPVKPLIAIDPGHGGEDLGARHFNLEGNMDFHESTITLEISLQLGAKLEALGYRVMYTRDGDYLPNPYPDPDKAVDLDESGQLNPRDDLLKRIDLVNEAQADLLLSIHLNAWETSDEELMRATGGTTTYYCPDRPFGEDNKRFADLVHEEVLSLLESIGHDVWDRGNIEDHSLASPGDLAQHLYILGPADAVIKRASEMPGALSEPVFITCDAEAELLQQAEFQDALAEAYARAIVRFFEEKP